MRGPDGSLSRAGSRSSTMVEVSSAILDIMKHMSVRIDFMTPADWPEVYAIYEEDIATGLGTFDSGCVCPACLHQWTETQCLSCSRWSSHSDWYAHS
jgi:hypothetical protein